MRARPETGDGWTLEKGKSLQKNIVQMRSFIC
jgi:hypothetical protein